MKSYPHIIIISGYGQDVGKTTFACNIIERVSGHINLSGLKISPHVHSDIGRSYLTLATSSTYSLFQDYDKNSRKDSSRFLKAGAEKSFYLHAVDDNLEDILPVLENYIDFNSPIICESGWLRTIINPGLFLIIKHIRQKATHKKINMLKRYADRIINFDGSEFDFDVNKIVYNKSGWKIE